MLKASEMKIVTNTEAQAAQDEVNRLLSKDWTLHGDLKVISHCGALTYAQALVKLQAFEPPGASPIAQPGGPGLFMR
jgi:hypothetical protein